MKKRKLKPFMVPVVYVLSLTMLIASVYFIEEAIGNTVFKSENVEEDKNLNLFIKNGHSKMPAKLSKTSKPPAK